jgi:hypothetical protein
VRINAGFRDKARASAAAAATGWARLAALAANAYLGRLIGESVPGAASPAQGKREDRDRRRQERIKIIWNRVISR